MELTGSKKYYKPPFAVSAYYYWKKGLNVFPIIPRTKKPACAWKHLQDKLMDESELKYMIRTYPNYNIGIVTGHVSQIVVVDVDGEDGDGHLKEFAIPQTLRANTTRGYHLYYKLPEGLHMRTANSLLPKVDIKADGGYVIAPPSVRPNGTGAYMWDQSPAVLTSLPVIPEWVVQKGRRLVDWFARPQDGASGRAVSRQGSWPNMGELIRQRPAMAHLIWATMHDHECVDPDIFNVSCLESAFERHMNRDADHAALLFLLVTFGRWFKRYGS